MKRIWMCLALLLLLAFAGQPALAQSKGAGLPPVNVVVRVELWQLTDQQMKSTQGKDVLPDFGQTRPLASVDVLTMTDSDALTHLGSKHPLTYFDPRAEQFQIQYVDIGMKLDVLTKRVTDTTFSVNVRPEVSVDLGQRVFGEAPDTVRYNHTAVMIEESFLPNLGYGQRAVLGRVSGPSAADFLSGFQNLPPHDNLVYTLKLEKV